MSSHDRKIAVALEAMTPGEYKNAGPGLRLDYGLHPGPFGTMLIAETARGVCWLAFVDGDGRDAAADAIREMRAHWPLSRCRESAAAARDTAEKLFTRRGGAFRLLAKGTDFQINVWRALLRIPYGEVASYKTVAASIRRPEAARAVAAAVGANHIAYLIPCHRVLRASGEPGGYRWGVERKLALLAREAATRP